jgi:hypothetical protein
MGSLVGVVMQRAHLVNMYPIRTKLPKTKASSLSDLCATNYYSSEQYLRFQFKFWQRNFTYKMVPSKHLALIVQTTGLK